MGLDTIPPHGTAQIPSYSQEQVALANKRLNEATLSGNPTAGVEALKDVQLTLATASLVDGIKNGSITTRDQLLSALFNLKI